ncbi:MAG: Uncharacterized protein XD95_0184 [Microgenomates bacterium 39_7]|nr:MAG: Uncharacterized protein XD95_0184 [Microgenomates bacterium 39_7]
MKIKHLYLKNYGPLANKEYRFNDGFNLLFGSNEKGKSLTFDALIKLLFGKEGKKFSDLNRVEDDPASFGGFLTLEIDQNKTKKEIRLQGKPTLSELSNLGPDECQNLFLIRNSELSIGKDAQDQDRFYTNLTDQLTGLKTEEIGLAKKKIADYAQLTDTYRFQSILDNQKLGERLDQAEKLLGPESKLSRLVEQDKKFQWSKLEDRLWQLQKGLKQIKTQLEEQEKAKKQEEYLTLKKRVEEIEVLQKDLKPFAQITQENLEKLRYAQQEISRLSEQKKELKQELEKKLSKSEEIEEQLTEITVELEKQSLIKEEVENSLQPESVLLIEQLASIQAQQKQPWKQLLFLSSALLIASLLAAVVQSQIFFVVMTGLLFIPTFVLGLKQYSQIQDQQRFDSRLNQLKIKLAKYDLETKDLEKIIKQITDLKQEYNSLAAKKATLSVEKKAIRDDINDARDKKLARCTSELSRQQELVKKILQDCSVKSDTQLREKLDEKRQLELKLQQVTTLVENQLGKPPFAQRAGEYYRSKLASYSQKSAEKVDTKYSSQLCENLQNKQKETQENLSQIKQNLETYKESLQDLQRVIKSILLERSESIVIDSMSDLLQAQQELENFVDFHQKRKTIAIKLIKILQELEQTEKRKVSELFGEDSPLSQRFNKITQGRYTQVYYDQDQHQIQVETASNKILKAQQLSSGTYDQLYFSIRISLGEKILQGEKGFFIMDDPFLKADQVRLKKQLQMLLELSVDGWQVIYFTAKEEVRNFFSASDVNLIEIK